MLCSICIGVLKDKANLITDQPQDDGPTIMCAHHRTTQSLQESADQHCFICFPFWNQLCGAEQDALHIEEAKVLNKKDKVQDDEDEDLFEWLTFTILRPDDMCGGDYVLALSFSGDGIDWKRVSTRKTIALSIVVFKSAVCETMVITPTQSQNTNSDESWSLATTWINDCLHNHTTCEENRDKSFWYPTRLLDLGDPATNAASVRLIDSEFETLSGPYCTLSHCWGKVQIIRLIQETAKSLRSGIDIDKLPKTFREAIIATKRLGVRYIWIDSLCIAQDDRSDWFREAALMHKVYSNSYCNLSASASSDSSQGLFRSRNPQLLSPTQANLYVKNLDPNQDFVLCDIYDYNFWTNNVSHCTINRRAWVTQERLLAPRVLHFGENQLFWECREQDACEAYPLGLPSLLENQIYTSFKALNPTNYRRKMAKQGKHIDPATETYAIWNMIVKSYSQTLLTVPGDKLIALSGIAKRIMATIDDVYIAGMWRAHLESLLLWHVKNLEQVDGSPSSRPTAYRAPSWSWASIDGVIATESTTQQGLVITACDVHLEYATVDTTGVITDGWLDLRGSLRPFSLSLQNLNGIKRWYMAVNGVLVRKQGENLENWESLGPNVWLDTPPPEDNAFERDNVEQRLFYMVGRMPSHENDYMIVLLLRLVDPGKGVYERFGLVESLPTDGGQEMLLGDLDEDVKKQLPCLRYEAGLHTIRIV